MGDTVGPWSNLSATRNQSWCWSTFPRDGMKRCQKKIVHKHARSAASNQGGESPRAAVRSGAVGGETSSAAAEASGAPSSEGGSKGTLLSATSGPGGRPSGPSGPVRVKVPPKAEGSGGRHGVVAPPAGTPDLPLNAPKQSRSQVGGAGLGRSEKNSHVRHNGLVARDPPNQHPVPTGDCGPIPSISLHATAHTCCSSSPSPPEATLFASPSTADV